MNKFYKNFSRRQLWIFATVVILAIISISILVTSNKDEAEVSAPAKRTVDLINVSEYRSGALGLTAPTADGRSFVVRAESGGRVNKVAALGEVTQGAVIAEIDNAAQRAALLQAQGIYEAALAGAQQSGISATDAATSLQSAKESAVNANRSAFTAWSGVLYNTVDELFIYANENNPNSRINPNGSRQALNSARAPLNQSAKDWESDLASLNANTNNAEIVNKIDRAISRVDSLSNLVNLFITNLTLQQPNESFSADDISRLQNSFSGAASALTGQRSALQGAKTAITRAEESVRSAGISSGSGANAQVKQALGAYQAARASYDKTIVRAPFAGRLVSTSVQVGDIINPGNDTAIIVPNEGVETSTSFNLPLASVKYTPNGAMVFVVNNENKLESRNVDTGLVTASTISVTGLTGEESIITDVRGLKAGDEVSANLSN